MKTTTLNSFWIKVQLDDGRFTEESGQNLVQTRLKVERLTVNPTQLTDNVGKMEKYGNFESKKKQKQHVTVNSAPIRHV